MKYFVRDKEDNNELEFDTMEEVQNYLSTLSEELISDGRSAEYYLQDYIEVIHGERIKPNLKLNISVTFG